MLYYVILCYIMSYYVILCYTLLGFCWRMTKCNNSHIFFMQEHFNFYAFDETHGPLILSVKSESVGEEEHSRIILR